MIQSLEDMRLDLGLAGVVTAVRALNRYIEVKKPWQLAKADNQQPLHNVLYATAECLRVAAALLHPVMPERMSTLRAALGIKDAQPVLGKIHHWGLLTPGAPVKDDGPLFPRIETKESKNVDEKPRKAPVEEPAITEDGLITIDDFGRVQLRTAIVLEAEKIEGADKLLRLSVRMGDERRQIVAGIALHYEPDALIGKTVVVVANLKPAKLRGVESQGMLLAASKGETLRLVAVDGEIASGAAVR
jgi:methionyl-tRNA synthetase